MLPAGHESSALILLPIVLIMLGSVLNTVLAADSGLRPLASFVAAPTTALLIGVLAAYLVIGRRAEWSKSRRSAVADSALPIVTRTAQELGKS